VAKIVDTLLAARWTRGLPHVLRKKISRFDTSHQHGADISGNGTHIVLRSESVGAPDGCSFLAPARKHRRRNDRLPIKSGQTVLESAIQLHVIVEIHHIAVSERLRPFH